MLRSVCTGLLAAALATGTAFAQSGPSGTGPEGTGLSAFSTYDDTSRLHVDYTAWSDLMRDIVLNVPPMDRKPERLRRINTGTRASTANESRYRYEANRVAYHMLSDEYRQAISDYRAELESLPSQIDFAALSSNEQLAYWFNLHNVAVVEQIMLDYPVTYINRMEAYGTNEDLFEARFLTVDGVPLSLNDIRLRIVYAQWDDPRVIYGFFNGAVGGPELNRNAFEGPQVWSQLDRNATEFVNALRGVEVSRSSLRVSHIYAEAARFFPDFDQDLRDHLGRFANADTAEYLVPGRRVRADIEDWHIADLINGSSRCTGSAGASTMLTTAPEVAGRGDGVNAPLNCAQLPSNGVDLINAVRLRRIELIQEGRYGEVFTNDIPTDPDGNRIRLEPAEEFRNRETGEED